MNYVFGPVPSRRLGRSLGVDTVPLKTCNWNCVYCQIGRSRPVVNARREYLPKEDILAEVKHALSLHQPGDIDWVTFVASGETTLHNGIGWLIRQVKEMTDIPVAVITNGSLLSQQEVREELMACDAVLPTLDAGSSEVFRRLNRPHPALTFERQVEGLIAFRREFTGSLWIEVMLVQGVNDTEDALKDLRTVLDRIGPDEVHLVSPTRSPVETSVRPTDEAGLMRATAILGEMITVAPSLDVTTELRGSDSVVDAVVDIVTRHPMSQEQLERALAQWAPGHVEEALRDLRADQRVQTVRRYGVLFWTGAHAVYPES
ncbi:MAG: radical SAM protein [Phycisphaerales bacterium]|nr:radical SAM protein [Phycisphaerales bacterium]